MDKQYLFYKLFKPWLPSTLSHMISKIDLESVDSEYWNQQKEFDIGKGWVMCVFYDCDEPDYIEYFITPSGKILDIWDWPNTKWTKKLRYLLNYKE